MLVVWCCTSSTSPRRGSPSSLPALPAAWGSSAPTATCTRREEQQSAPVWCCGALQVLRECPGPVTSDFRGTDGGRRAGGKAIKSYFCVSHRAPPPCHSATREHWSRAQGFQPLQTVTLLLLGSICKVHNVSSHSKGEEIGRIQNATIRICDQCHHYFGFWLRVTLEREKGIILILCQKSSGWPARMSRRVGGTSSSEPPSL